MVTFLGSPPKAAMLSRTHLRALMMPSLRRRGLMGVGMIDFRSNKLPGLVSQLFIIASKFSLKIFSSALSDNGNVSTQPFINP